MSKSSFGLPLAILLLLWVSGCTGVNPLNLLTGSGPNVAANVQAGETNTQTLGTTEVSNVDIKESDNVVVSNDKNEVKSDGGPVTVNKNEVDPLLIILLILGWLAPSPQEIGKGILNLFRRNK